MVDFMRFRQLFVSEGGQLPGSGSPESGDPDVAEISCRSLQYEGRRAMGRGFVEPGAPRGLGPRWGNQVNSQMASREEVI